MTAYHETIYNYIEATQLHNVNTLIQNWSFNGLRINCGDSDSKPIYNFKLILIPLRSFHICIERVDLNFEGIKISLIKIFYKYIHIISKFLLAGDRWKNTCCHWQRIMWPWLCGGSLDLWLFSAQGYTFHIY